MKNVFTYYFINKLSSHNFIIYARNRTIKQET